VPVSIGIAPTKNTGKTCQHHIEKNKVKTGCIAVLETEEKITKALKMIAVKDLWGVGRQSAKKLAGIAINTAWDLRQMPEEWARKNLGGVVGVRLIKELRGEKAIVMDVYKDKKMIATTRMFGDAVSDLGDIKEAVATYTSRAAEKLRRQQGAAGTIHVFVVTNEKGEGGPHFKHGSTYRRHRILSSPPLSPMN
jgi:DNA polymerase V